MPQHPLQPVPLLDLSREFALIRDEVMAAIERVCTSQRFILGPEVQQFEHSAAAACEVPYAIGCASGTDALWLALAALHIGPGDFVITTPFSFFATVSSILRAGATPLLSDIDEKTFNLSPKSVSFQPWLLSMVSSSSKTPPRPSAPVSTASPQARSAMQRLSASIPPKTFPPSAMPAC